MNVSKSTFALKLWRLDPSTTSGAGQKAMNTIGRLHPKDKGTGDE